MARINSDRAPKALVEAERLARSRYRAASEEIPEPHRVYLKVPYSQRVEAKKLGCVWDAGRKAWWTRAAPETLPANWLVKSRPVDQTAPERATARYRGQRRAWRDLELANRELDLLEPEQRCW